MATWEAGDYLSLSEPSSNGLSFSRQVCTVDVAGRTSARLVEGTSVVVTGPEGASWLRVEQPSEVLEVSLGADFRAAIADELSAPEAADLADLSLAAGPVPWAIAARMRIIVRDGQAGQELAVEALARQLYGHVLRTRFGGRMRERGDGALDARRLARVAEFIDAHLGETPASACSPGSLP